MANGRRVLVVDGLSETEQVLKAVLEPRGLTVDRVRVQQAGGELRESARPNVVVIHEEETPLDRNRLKTWGRIPRVIIGSTAVPPSGENGDGEHFLQKPFQYPELIQAIERLLGIKSRESRVESPEPEPRG